MAKQTFKEKVHATKHLEYIRDDSAIRMRLYKGKDISGKLIGKATGQIFKRRTLTVNANQIRSILNVPEENVKDYRMNLKSRQS